MEYMPIPSKAADLGAYCQLKPDFSLYIKLF